MWASMVRQASQGDPEAMEMLQAANKSRAARNLPTVEDELQTIAEQQEKAAYQREVAREFKRFM